MKALTIREAAAKAGVPYRTFIRRAKAIHEQSDGTFLVGRPARITHASLQKWMPDLFDDTRTVEEKLGELRQQVEEQEWKIDEMNKSMKAFRKQAWEWFNRLPKAAT